MYDKGRLGLRGNVQAPTDLTGQQSSGTVTIIGANAYVFTSTPKSLLNTMLDGTSNVIMFATVAQKCNVTTTAQVPSGQSVYNWKGQFLYYPVDYSPRSSPLPYAPIWASPSAGSGSWTIYRTDSTSDASSPGGFYTYYWSGTFTFYTATTDSSSNPSSPQSPQGTSSGSWTVQSNNPIYVSQTTTSAVASDWTASSGRHLVTNSGVPYWNISSVANCSPDGWSGFGQSGISVCLGDGSVKEISAAAATSRATGSTTAISWQAGIRPDDGIDPANW